MSDPNSNHHYKENRRSSHTTDFKSIQIPSKVKRELEKQFNRLSDIKVRKLLAILLSEYSNLNNLPKGFYQLNSRTQLMEFIQPLNEQQLLEVRTALETISGSKKPTDPKPIMISPDFTKSTIEIASLLLDQMKNHIHEVKRIFASRYMKDRSTLTKSAIDEYLVQNGYPSNFLNLAFCMFESRKRIDYEPSYFEKCVSNTDFKSINSHIIRQYRDNLENLIDQFIDLDNRVEFLVIKLQISIFNELSNQLKTLFSTQISDEMGYLLDRITDEEIFHKFMIMLTKEIIIDLIKPNGGPLDVLNFEPVYKSVLVDFANLEIDDYEDKVYSIISSSLFKEVEETEIDQIIYFNPFPWVN